jgi:GNAT superfamily N-acetyltransferase
MQASKAALCFAFLADRADAIPTVATWYYETWGNLPGNSVQKTIERIHTKLNRGKPPCHILAISDNHVVGVAQFKRHEMLIYPEKEFWLGGLFVAPEWRSRGVGAALTNEVTIIAQAFGAKQLYLQTEALDGGLYAQLGWKLIEITTATSVPVAVMMKQLAE